MLVGTLPFYSTDLNNLFNTIARCDLPLEDVSLVADELSPIHLPSVVKKGSPSLLDGQPRNIPTTAASMGSSTSL